MMLRQALAAPSRALRSNACWSIISQRPLARPPSFASPLAIRIQPPPTRWYSEAKEEPKETLKETPQETSKGTPKETPKGAAETAKEGRGDNSKNSEEGEDVPPAAESPEAELKKKLEAKEKEAIDWKDKCLRTIADFRNLQDRTQRDIKNAREFAISGFAKDLVESIDNFDRALSMVPEEKLKNAEKSEELKDFVNLHEGLKMTETILMNTLKKHGLERFDPIGEKFNPNEHEATFQAPQEGKEDNTVFFTQQKGFKLNSRILRAAKVGVVKNK